MAEIAALARVSVPTVSRALAGASGVSEETRQLVDAAAQELGYERRATRMSLRDAVIDLIIEGIFDPWTMEFIIGAEASAHAGGYSLVVTSTEHPDFTFREWVGSRRRRKTDGVVLVLSQAQPEAVKLLLTLQCPVVLVDPVGYGESQAITVGAANWAGGLSATRHLLRLGHRRVAFLGGPETTTCVRERHEGYVAAHHELGLTPDPALTLFARYNADSGKDAASRLLGSANPPTAVFAAADILAVGTYHAAAAFGLGVPADLSVVGFDDTTHCKIMDPKITTVRQPLAQMAVEALRLIELSRAGDAGTPRRVELATTFVNRGSTAAIGVVS
jgi:DNA-binding LacI/PurR family transcriptional regulator